jgi:aryl-alcohol dehydrogenase-like predicted oxidoreductase
MTESSAVLDQLGGQLNALRRQNYELRCERHQRNFGRTGYSFFNIGAGTIWLGRPWPPSSTRPAPEQQEIAHFLASVFELTPGNRIMVDTAAGYGESEANIGKWFRGQPTLVFDRAFIASKFGENFDTSTGVTTVALSAAAALSSFERSKQDLGGRIDLFYSHITSQISSDEAIEVLRDTELSEALIALKVRSDGVQLLGTSISHAAALKTAMAEGLLAHLDVVQIPSTMAFDEPELVRQLAVDGKAVVVNSPVRKISKGSTPCEAFEALLAVRGVCMVLTGTRTHLAETLRYNLPVKGVAIRIATAADAPSIRMLWLANHSPG